MLADGLLWHDRLETRSFAAKVYRAVSYYNEKYAPKQADVCIVNAQTLTDQGIADHDGLYVLIGHSEEESKLLFRDDPLNALDDPYLIEIRVVERGVLPYHYWLGEDE